ncbi:hypothetical protein B0T10DRAFT_158034 [Thelonectria olida]|uniref:Uncharacterized protein n=1 Tax=Thelonectria olida TaxID=1576542 RepID=A0A9P8VUU5_9HYPO|nr:hypothetical protein B0T10DRAFT_158034 [Thelonectria olida]
MRVSLRAWLLVAGLLATPVATIQSASSTSALSTSVQPTPDPTGCGTQAPNLVLNPSWEQGLTVAWSYPLGTPYWGHGDGTQGNAYLNWPAAYSAEAKQTLSNLEVGTQYTVSIDLKMIVNGAGSSGKGCGFDLGNEVNGQVSLVNSAYFTFDETADRSWQTFTGTWVAQSTDFVFHMRMACTFLDDTYGFRLDNAVVRAPPNAPCPTTSSTSSTTSLVSTPQSTPTASPSTTPTTLLTFTPQSTPTTSPSTTPTTLLTSTPQSTPTTSQSTTTTRAPGKCRPGSGEPH